MLRATYRFPVPVSNMFMSTTVIPVRMSIAPSPDTTHSHISAQTNYPAEATNTKSTHLPCSSGCHLAQRSS